MCEASIKRVKQGQRLLQALIEKCNQRYGMNENEAKYQLDTVVAMNLQF